MDRFECLLNFYCLLLYSFQSTKGIQKHIMVAHNKEFFSINFSFSFINPILIRSCFFCAVTVIRNHICGQYLWIFLFDGCCIFKSFLFIILSRINKFICIKHQHNLYHGWTKWCKKKRREEVNGHISTDTT